MITKKGLSILLAGTMVLSLAACGGSTETAKAANSGGTEATQENAAEKKKEPIVVNVCESGNSVVSLDFYKYSLHPEWQYAECVYDSLLHASYDGKFEPEICTSYEIAEDGLSAVLHLADGVKFQDGTVLNADDVVCTLNYLGKNKETLAMISTVWGNLVGAEKVDDLTVKVNMDKKYHAFEAALGYTFIF